MRVQGLGPDHFGVGVSGKKEEPSGDEARATLFHSSALAFWIESTCPNVPSTQCRHAPTTASMCRAVRCHARLLRRCCASARCVALGAVSLLCVSAPGAALKRPDACATGGDRHIWPHAHRGRQTLIAAGCQRRRAAPRVCAHERAAWKAGARRQADHLDGYVKGR